MITKFDKKTTDALLKEVANLLQNLAESHGLEVRAAGGSFGTDAATLKFEFRATSEEAEKAAFAESCALFGIKPDSYGATGTINGREMKLIGFELRRAKFPIRAREVATGKVTLFTEEALRRGFKLTPYADAAMASAPLSAHPTLKV